MKLGGVKMQLTSSQLTERLVRLLKDERYKDITLTSHDQVVMAHKCVLAISSQFFQLLFQQAEQNKDLFQRSSFELVGLEAGDATHLEAVIDFLYSGVIYLNDVNIVGIVKLADYLAIEELLDMCERFIKLEVNPESYLKIYLNMKEVNPERKGGNSTSILMNSLWEMVEKNFYDHIIDNHDFIEIIPEEVTGLLEKNFDVVKILSLAVRWMKSQPLGFTFAESLINITHRQLKTAAQLQNKVGSESSIISLIEILREQIQSRTVPNSNCLNMRNKLANIQKQIDPLCVETENIIKVGKPEEGNNGGISSNVAFKDESGGFQVNDNDNEHFSRKMETNENDRDNTGKIAEISSALVVDNTNVVEAKVGVDQEHKEEIGINSNNTGLRDSESQPSRDITARSNCEIDQGGGNSGKLVDIVDTMGAAVLDTTVDNQDATNVEYIVIAGLEAVSPEKPMKSNNNERDMDISEDLKNESNEEANNLDESNYPKAMDNAETSDVGDVVREVKVEITSRDTGGDIECIENKKLDGTEPEKSNSSELNEAALHNRVSNCLEIMMKSFKTELETEGELGATRKTQPRGRKRKGRPKKCVSSLPEENVNDWTSQTKTRLRGRKRKAAPVSFSNDDTSDLDETTISAEIDNVESSNEKTDVDIGDALIENDNIDDDSDDDVADEKEESDQAFQELLKQAMGSEIDETALNKKAKKSKSPKKSGFHECEICHQVYSQKYRLTQHMNKHLGIKPYKCVVCLLNFTRTDHVVRHMKTKHKDMETFKCDECDEEFDKPNEVVAHSAAQHQHDSLDDKMDDPITEAEKEHLEVAKDEEGKFQYTCKSCNQLFKRRYQAREHVYMHTGEKPFKCQFCESKFGRKENLAAHVKSVHDGYRGEHKCAKCKRFFMKKENYDAHVENCKPNYKCDDCPMQFYRKTHLENHKPVHDPTPQHQCPHCDSKYRYRKHMVRHIRNEHMEEKDPHTPCICDTCGVVVKNKEALYRHKKCHKLPDKECDVCGKAFKDNTTLKDHKLMHTNIRDYQCEICSMLFARKGNLVRHQKRHRGERKYRCDICGMCFVANCDLTRHKNTHLGVKKFPCRYCGRKFGLKSKVVVHERTHTGERPYFCREENCGKTFKQTGDRVRHEKKVHNLTFNKYMTLYELATGETEDIFKGAEPPKKPLPEAVPETSTAEESANYPSVMTLPTADGTSMTTLAYNPATQVMGNSYIEEAEMSKIFQRTVAAISQEAIANSGLYN